MICTDNFNYFIVSCFGFSKHMTHGACIFKINKFHLDDDVRMRKNEKIVLGPE